MNCTPGAIFQDLTKEVNGIGIPPSTKDIFIVCGTNYLSMGHQLVERHMTALHERLVEKSSNGTKVRLKIFTTSKKYRTVHFQ